jgi:ankyrin repeat protein
LSGHLPSPAAFKLRRVVRTGAAGSSEGDEEATLREIERLVGDVEPDIRVDLAGNTALHVACIANKLERVRLLLALKADPNLCNDDGVSSLRLAYENRGAKADAELMKLLLENGANTSATLHTAATTGDDDIIKMLDKFKADLNARTSDGTTPLWLAIEARHKSTVKLLLALGVNPSAPNDDGRSPLILAIDKQDLTLAGLLVEHNADPNYQSRQYFTSPMELAFIRGETDLARLLLRHGGKIDGRSSRVQAALAQDEGDLRQLIKEQEREEERQAQQAKGAQQKNLLALMNKAKQAVKQKEDEEKRKDDVEEEKRAEAVRAALFSELDEGDGKKGAKATVPMILRSHARTNTSTNTRTLTCTLARIYAHKLPRA